MSTRTNVWMLIVYVLGFYGMLASGILIGDYYREVSSGCYVCGSSTFNPLYKSFLGIPNAAYGIAFFAIFMILAGLGQLGKIGEKSVLKTVFALSLAGLVVGVSFIYIMIFVLEEVCWWCLSLDFTLALLLSFSLFRIYRP